VLLSSSARSWKNKLSGSEELRTRRAHGTNKWLFLFPWEHLHSGSVGLYFSIFYHWSFFQSWNESSCLYYLPTYCSWCSDAPFCLFSWEVHIYIYIYYSFPVHTIMHTIFSKLLYNCYAIMMMWQWKSTIDFMFINVYQNIDFTVRYFIELYDSSIKQSVKQHYSRYIMP